MPGSELMEAGFGVPFLAGEHVQQNTVVVIAQATLMVVLSVELLELTRLRAPESVRARPPRFRKKQGRLETGGIFPASDPGVGTKRGISPLPVSSSQLWFAMGGTGSLLFSAQGRMNKQAPARRPSLQKPSDLAHPWSPLGARQSPNEPLRYFRSRDYERVEQQQPATKQRQKLARRRTTNYFGLVRTVPLGSSTILCAPAGADK